MPSTRRFSRQLDHMFRQRLPGMNIGRLTPDWTSRAKFLGMAFIGLGFIALLYHVYSATGVITAKTTTVVLRKTQEKGSFARIPPPNVGASHGWSPPGAGIPYGCAGVVAVCFIVKRARRKIIVRRIIRRVHEH